MPGVREGPPTGLRSPDLPQIATLAVGDEFLQSLMYDRPFCPDWPQLHRMANEFSVQFDARQHDG